MIHQLLSQANNPYICRESWNNLYKSFPNQTKLTITHILIHALWEDTFVNLFRIKGKGKEEYKKLKNPKYKQAWEIIFEKSYEKVIEEFKSKIIN